MAFVSFGCFMKRYVLACLDPAGMCSMENLENCKEKFGRNPKSDRDWKDQKRSKEKPKERLRKDQKKERPKERPKERQKKDQKKDQKKTKRKTERKIK